MSEIDRELEPIPEFHPSLHRPTPEDFHRMSRAQFEDYIRVVELEMEARDALAEFEQLRAAGLQTPEAP